MVLFTLLLVLLSAFLHAFWNALLKKAANLEATSLGILTVSLASTAIASLVLRGLAFPDGLALAWGVGGGLFEGLYFLTLAQALERAPLGWSYTWMRGGSLLLVWPVSLLFLGEGAGALSVLCVLAVCGGLAFMGLDSGGPGGNRHGLRWAGAVATAIAGYTLCYKASLAHGAHPIPLYATSMAVSLPFLVAAKLLHRGWTREAFLPTQLGLVLAAGLLCTASFLLYLQSLALGGAGVMATLRNTSVVFAVLFSWALGERPTPRQWAGACLVTLGAAGLALHP